MDYLEKLELSPGQKTDVSEVKAKTRLNRTQAGMKLALEYWQNKNQLEATFRALLLILLSLLKGDVAVQLCKYLSDKCESKLWCHECERRHGIEQINKGLNSSTNYTHVHFSYHQEWYSPIVLFPQTPPRVPPLKRRSCWTTSCPRTGTTYKVATEQKYQHQPHNGLPSQQTKSFNSPWFRRRKYREGELMMNLLG